MAVSLNCDSPLCMEINLREGLTSYGRSGGMANSFCMLAYLPLREPCAPIEGAVRKTKWRLQGGGEGSRAAVLCLVSECRPVFTLTNAQSTYAELKEHNVRYNTSGCGAGGERERERERDVMKGVKAWSVGSIRHHTRLRPHLAVLTGRN